MAVPADLLLVHVAQHEVFRIDEAIRQAGVDVAEIAGERPDIVVVVLRPAGEMRAAQPAGRPGDAEG